MADLELMIAYVARFKAILNYYLSKILQPLLIVIHQDMSHIAVIHVHWCRYNHNNLRDRCP